MCGLNSDEDYKHRTPCNYHRFNMIELKGIVTAFLLNELLLQDYITRTVAPALQEEWHTFCLSSPLL